MRGIAVALTALALPLLACSETGDPVSLPEPTSSVRDRPSELQTALPTPSPTAPDQPPSFLAEAYDHMESYFRSANLVARGQDIAEHELLYSMSCQACVSATRDFEEARERGLRADGDRYASWTLETAQAEPGQVVVTSTIDFAAVNLVDEAGEIAEEVPAWEGATFVWTLREQGAQTWLIVQGDLLS